MAHIYLAASNLNDPTSIVKQFEAILSPKANETNDLDTHRSFNLLANQLGAHCENSEEESKGKGYGAVGRSHRAANRTGEAAAADRAVGADGANKADGTYKGTREFGYAD